MLSVLLSICFLSLVSQTRSQLPGRAPCPVVTPMTDLDVKKIGGTWYTQKRINNADEQGHTCSKVIITANSNETMTIWFGGIMQPAGQTYAWEGLAIPAKQPSFGSYRLTYPSWAAEAEISIILLGTDYNNYAVVSSCDLADGAFYQYAWIFGRSPTVTTHVNKGLSILESNNIPPSALSDVDHSHCIT